MIVLSHKMADNYGVPDVDNEVCNWDPYAQDAPGSFPETRRALDETAAMVIDKKGLPPTLEDNNQVEQVLLRQTLMTEQERCELKVPIQKFQSAFQSGLTVAVHDLNIPPLSGGPDDVSKSSGCIDPAGVGNPSTATSSESETSSKSIHEHTEGVLIRVREPPVCNKGFLICEMNASLLRLLLEDAATQRNLLCFQYSVRYSG